MASSSTTAPQSCHSEQLLSPRKKKKNHKDPFLQLPITPSPVLTPNGSPTGESTDPFNSLPSPRGEASSSFLQKVFLTPLIMTSFILSLFFVNHRDRSSRLAGTLSPSLRTFFSPRAWLSPEPYQDPSSATWGSSSTTPWPGTHGQDASGKWFIRKKHRKMANLQFGDALEMRGRVVWGMCVVSLLGVMALVWVIKRMMSWSQFWSFH